MVFRILVKRLPVDARAGSSKLAIVHDNLAASNDNPDIGKLGEVFEWIPVNHDDVGNFAGLEAADLIAQIEVSCR